MTIDLQEMHTFPKDGSFCLVFDKFMEPKVLNAPDGYEIGTWHKTKQGKWTGYGVASYFIPVYWCHLPKVRKPDYAKKK